MFQFYYVDNIDFKLNSSKLNLYPNSIINIQYVGDLSTVKEITCISSNLGEMHTIMEGVFQYRFSEKDRLKISVIKEGDITEYSEYVVDHYINPPIVSLKSIYKIMDFNTMELKEVSYLLEDEDYILEFFIQPDVYIERMWCINNPYDGININKKLNNFIDLHGKKVQIYTGSKHINPDYIDDKFEIDFGLLEYRNNEILYSKYSLVIPILNIDKI